MVEWVEYYYYKNGSCLVIDNRSDKRGCSIRAKSLDMVYKITSRREVQSLDLFHEYSRIDYRTICFYLESGCNVTIYPHPELIFNLLINGSFSSNINRILLD